VLKYFSLDLETTGLDPKKHQVIQLAVVYDNGGPIETLPRFVTDVWQPIYCGEPTALAMNKAIFERLAEVKSPNDLPVLRSYPWAYTHESITKQIVAAINTWTGEFEELPVFAGKNFSSFDRQFLPGLRGHHRAIDVGSMFMLPTDSVVPSTEACLVRAGLNATISHDALQDALNVIRLVRHKLQ
jgi:oligoribonuclease